MKRTGTLKKGSTLNRTSGIRKKLKDPSVIQQEKEDQKAMWDVFLEVWNDTRGYSEVSGSKIHGECKTIYCHHILPKSKYPEAKYDKENIIILTWEEHDNVENDPTLYKEVNRRRELLKMKYNIT